MAGRRSVDGSHVRSYQLNHELDYRLRRYAHEQFGGNMSLAARSALCAGLDQVLPWTPGRRKAYGDEQRELHELRRSVASSPVVTVAPTRCPECGNADPDFFEATHDVWRCVACRAQGRY